MIEVVPVALVVVVVVLVWCVCVLCVLFNWMIHSLLTKVRQKHGFEISSVFKSQVSRGPIISRLSRNVVGSDLLAAYL